MQLPDAVRRALRTFLQDFIRTFLLLVTVPNVLQEAVSSSNAADSVPDLSTLKAALVAAAWSASLALLTYILNALEDRGTIPALFKAPASSGVDPIPDPDADDPNKPD